MPTTGNISDSDTRIRLPMPPLAPLCSGPGIGRIGLDGVVAIAAINLGIGGAIHGVDLVITVIAEELIWAETTDNTVGSGAAVQRVGAAATCDGVSAAAAIDGRGE